MYVFMDKYEKVSINSLCYPFLPGALTALCKLCQEKRDLLKGTLSRETTILYAVLPPQEGQHFTGKQNAPVGADSKIRLLLEGLFLHKMQKLFF